MDPSTRRSLLVVGILVAVLVVLFVVGVAYRPADDGGGSGCSPEARDRWRDRLLGSGAVALDDVSGCARDGVRIAVPGRCQLTVAAADARSRTLVIVAVDAIEIMVATDADGRKITMRAKIKPGQNKQLMIGKEGQTIGIRCLDIGATRCQVRVE